MLMFYVDIVCMYYCLIVYLVMKVVKRRSQEDTLYARHKLIVILGD